MGGFSKKKWVALVRAIWERYGEGIIITLRETASAKEDANAQRR